MWVLGVDLGSVSAKFLVLDPGGEVAYYAYTRTLGAPLAAVTNGLAEALVVLHILEQILAERIISEGGVKERRTKSFAGKDRWNNESKEFLRDCSVGEGRDGWRTVAR
jgi:hypothetical protein